jgi:carboxypeptidase Taq
MVQPSLIRTSADEVTYALHIILRYELERKLLAGSVAAIDLPVAFDATMRDYLGRQPSDISQGVLQDPHWFDLDFGYFPTITLGDIVSVQLWERAEANLGDLDSQFEKGDFDTLRAWLADNLHIHGRKFTAPETIKEATGKPLDAGPYITYLRRKYTMLLGADD